MKHNRFYSLIAVLLMASAPLFGGTVGVEHAKALGAKFVEANFKNNTPLEWVYTAVTENGRASFHVFNGATGGFVIVSASDLTSPILGYAGRKPERSWFCDRSGMGKPRTLRKNASHEISGRRTFGCHTLGPRLLL